MRKSLNLKMHDYIHRPEGKLVFNREMFTVIAGGYDFITRALSLGRDKVWKNEMIRRLPALQRPRCLDLACGTGDITFRMAQKYPRGTIVGLDLTEAMIASAKSRNSYENVEFTTANMCRTEFGDHTFDIVTGGYALRNAPVLEEALAEIRRVMKPGGMAAFLDFSKPAGRLGQETEYFLLKVWGGFWGLALHRNPEVYTYIAESLKQFPDRDQLRKLIARAGFEILWSKKHYFGMAETVMFKKPSS